MDIEKIIETYCDGQAETKKRNIRNWFSQVQKIAGDTPLLDAFKSTDFLLKCFFTSKTNTISRSQYQRIKEILLYICDYACIDNSIIPAREDVIESSQMQGFFRDLPSVLSYIDEVAEAVISGYKKVPGMLRLKSIAILAWFGFSPMEIADMSRLDIKTSEKYCIQTKEKSVEIPPEFLKTILLQAEQNYVATFPNGKIYTYKVETDYVIKNHSGNPMLADHIRHLFKRFNEVSNYSNVLSFKGLQISGLFSRIHEDATNEELHLKIQRHANCNRTMSYGYKKIYGQWLKKFFNEEI